MGGWPQFPPQQGVVLCQCSQGPAGLFCSPHGQAQAPESGNRLSLEILIL